MKRITPQDIQKGVEYVSASPESTYYIRLNNLDNGDELCLAFGMGEGFDEPTVCAKIAVLAGNSAMSDYEWDFVMPYEAKSGSVWDTEVSNPGESDAEWFNTQAAQIARKLNSGKLVASACGKKKPVKSSRRPIQSMYVTQDISGNDLYTCLWSGGKDQFDSMIEDGADADDILNACEELLFREEGNPPTMTELNDLIWFSPDLIRDYIGLSNPIESGCHGKSKKDKKKKKAVESAMQIAEIHNNTSNLFVRVVYVSSSLYWFDDYADGELLSLNEFKQLCKDFAETSNGYYEVNQTNEHKSVEYTVDFANWESENGDEQLLGLVKFELICDAGEELCNYLEDDRMM